MLQGQFDNNLNLMNHRASQRAQANHLKDPDKVQSNFAPLRFASSILARNDPQTYQALVSILLQVAREFQVPSALLRNLRGYLFSPSNVFLPFSHSQIQDGEFQELLEYEGQGGLSIFEQREFLEQMIQELQKRKEKQIKEQHLRAYAQQRMNQFNPILSCTITSRKKCFSSKVQARMGPKNSFGGKSDIQNLESIQIIKKFFSLQNECYRKMKSFVKLKTLFGHAFESDYQHACPIYNCIFDRTEKLVITGGQDGLIKIWDKSSGFLLTNLKGHTDYINKVETSKCNKYLITSGKEGVRFFSMVGMTSLGGWHKTESIMDITSVYRNGSSEIIFCDQRRLYLLSEQDMLRNRERQLFAGDFSIYCFDHLILKPCNVNTITLSKDSTLCLLGLQNGQIMLFHYADLEACQPQVNPDNFLHYFLLPARHIFQAHKEDIIEAKWNSDNVHFVTGGKEGCCYLWEYKDDKEPKVLTQTQATKALNRRKRKTFACTYICWNSIESHFISGFKQLVDDEEDRGDGDLVVYRLKDHKVVCNYTEDVGRMSSVCCLDAHPYYPNIILIGEGNGKLSLFDIILQVTINVFQQKGYHLHHPQFSLVLSDCKFSQDGNYFIVASEEGSVSIYGYDIRCFYEMCPDEQFLGTDFQKIELDEYSMMAMPSIISEPIDINQMPRGTIGTLQGVQYQHMLRVDVPHFLKYLTQKKKPFCPLTIIDPEFLLIFETNSQRSAKQKEFYQANLLESKMACEEALENQRKRQEQIIKNMIMQYKLSIPRLKESISEDSEQIINAWNTRRNRPRRLKKVVMDYSPAQLIEDHSEQSDYLHSKIQSDEEGSLQQDSDSDSDSAPRPTRRSRVQPTGYNTRNRNSLYTYEQYNLDIDRQSSMAAKTQHKKPIDQDIKDMLESDEYKNYNGRKRIKQERPQEIIGEENTPEDSCKNSRRNTHQSSVTCDRCRTRQVQKICYKCKTMKVCDSCANRRGKSVQETYCCFDCILEMNEEAQIYDKVTEKYCRLQKRSIGIYIPQLEDQVRYFFQGYQEFINENVCNLNKRALEGQQSKLLPHTQLLSLTLTPLCVVQEIKYFFPCRSLGLFRKRNRIVSETYPLQMYLKLKTQQEDEFWVYFIPETQFLVPEFIFEAVSGQKGVHQNQLRFINNQQFQIVKVQPLETIFKDSLWKRIAIRKSENKRLRGGNKDLELKSPWNFDELVDGLSYPTAVSSRHCAKLVRQIDMIETAGSQEAGYFLDFVDLQAYPNYRFVVEVGACLSNIRARLKNNYYSSYASLEENIKLLYNNAVKFNAEGHFVSLIAASIASRLIAIFKKDQNKNLLTMLRRPRNQQVKNLYFTENQEKRQIRRSTRTRNKSNFSQYVEESQQNLNQSMEDYEEDNYDGEESHSQKPGRQKNRFEKENQFNGYGRRMTRSKTKY